MQCQELSKVETSKGEQMNETISYTDLFIAIRERTRRYNETYNGLRELHEQERLHYCPRTAKRLGSDRENELLHDKELHQGRDKRNDNGEQQTLCGVRNDMRVALPPSDKGEPAAVGEDVQSDKSWYGADCISLSPGLRTWNKSISGWRSHRPDPSGI